MSVSPDVTGAISDYDWPKTLALAASLQPTARDVVVISGASEHDRYWNEDARRDLEPYFQSYNVRYLAGLPHEALLEEVARLPRETIVILLPIFMDGSGRARIPTEVAADVVKASSAPVYAPIDTFLGVGIVGGYMDTFEIAGIAAADLVVEVLARGDSKTIPPPIWHAPQLSRRCQTTAAVGAPREKPSSRYRRPLQGTDAVGATSRSRACNHRRFCPADCHPRCLVGPDDQTQARRSVPEAERAKNGVCGRLLEYRPMAIRRSHQTAMGDRPLPFHVRSGCGAARAGKVPARGSPRRPSVGRRRSSIGRTRGPNGWAPRISCCPRKRAKTLAFGIGACRVRRRRQAGQSERCRHGHQQAQDG